eukprot:CAMPEP_0176471304 /NCGR_PEP_ID=MMETSP0127-20121128/41054_1 /TAXON_ID=938130 /ORGANISM="Platyophrya macrostoma, Strain WH" /LENGTH=56 /DNA_ID=CAMNT_0017865929 /DNA_START=13 /DNA_END=179 /DNA_ORIENTATION=+
MSHTQQSITSSPVVSSVTLDPSLMIKLQTTPNLDVKQWINAMMQQIKATNEGGAFP